MSDARDRRFARLSLGRALPPAAIAFVLAVEVGYLAVLIVAGLRTAWHGSDAVIFGLLTASAIVCAEVALRHSWPYRTRRTAADLLGIWTLPAVVLLPPFYAAVITVPIGVYLALRVVRPPLVKWLFNRAAAGLAGAGASWLFHSVLLSGPVGRTTTESGAAAVLGAAALALVLRIVVNGAFVAAVVSFTESRVRFVDAVREGHDTEIVATEFCMGALVAAGIVINPLLVLVAIPPAILLQRAMFVAELRKAATTDAKTGTANAAHWRDVAERELARALGGTEPLSVLMVDVDHFKEVNDRHGHLIGDEVLAAVADAITTEVRPRDLVGRFGGEEFVVLLAGSNLLDAHGAAERIRYAVATRVTHGIQVTVSIGVSGLRVNGHGLHELLDAADTALYAAKNAGRNRVRVSGPSEQQILDLSENRDRTVSQ